MHAIGRDPPRPPDGVSIHYERLRPENTTMYRLVQQHAASFIAHTEVSMPTFVEASAPADDALHTLLQTVITRLMKLHARRGLLIEDMGQTYQAEPEADADQERTMRPLQVAGRALQAAPGRALALAVHRSATVSSNNPVG